MRSFLRSTLVPLCVILLCPPTVLIAWHICANLDGSLDVFLNQIMQNGFFTEIYRIWSPVFWGTGIAWKSILIFMAVQLILMRIIPGRRVTGPATPKGNTPVYKKMA